MLISSYKYRFTAGRSGIEDGDIVTCRLNHPWVLLITEGKLYIGGSGGIRLLPYSIVTGKFVLNTDKIKKTFCKINFILRCIIELNKKN